jgi:hypothetical protein
MNIEELADLLNRECVLIESGRGRIMRCVAFRENDASIYADLVGADSTLLVMNRIRMNDEPAIGSWSDDAKKVGEPLTIFQPRSQVFRSGAYLQFSSPFGGTRLFFLAEYVEKVRSRDPNGWEWEDIMAKCSESDDQSAGSSAA